MTNFWRLLSLAYQFFYKMYHLRDIGRCRLPKPVQTSYFDRRQGIIVYTEIINGAIEQRVGILAPAYIV